MEEMRFNVCPLMAHAWRIEQNGVSAFLFEGETEALLIDCCFGGDLAGICRELTDRPLKVALTHADRDHVGAAEQFGELWMHPAEMSVYEEKNGRKLKNARPLWEGDTVDLGRFSFRVIHIPGHTPGSVAYLETKTRTLFAGDSVQNCPIFMFGAGRNMFAFHASMEKLLGMETEWDTVIGSHCADPVPKDILKKLGDASAELMHGIRPEPQPAPARLPASVSLYEKDAVAFYLE